MVMLTISMKTSRPGLIAIPAHRMMGMPIHNYDHAHQTYVYALLIAHHVHQNFNSTHRMMTTLSA